MRTCLYKCILCMCGQAESLHVDIILSLVIVILLSSFERDVEINLIFPPLFLKRNKCVEYGPLCALYFARDR